MVLDEIFTFGLKVVLDEFVFCPIIRPDCLHKLRKAHLREMREVAVRGSREQHPHSYNHTVDVGVHEFWSRCETVGMVSRRPSVCPCLHNMCSTSHLHFLLVVNTCVTRLL